VEVFIPPYLLSGQAQPTYTIKSTDWGYNASVDFTITAHTADIPKLKVSLLGAVSSTHGNSMGQRTLFPDVTCPDTGTTCTITTPLNAHVCPPGWYQLWLLDNGVPSNATWVRIGGDPASLGNWPDFPDFKLPGV